MGAYSTQRGPDHSAVVAHVSGTVPLRVKIDLCMLRRSILVGGSIVRVRGSDQAEIHVSLLGNAREQT